MHITGYHQEQWDLMDRGVDRETGYEMVHVRHRSTQGVTVFRLVRYPQGWRKVGDFIPHFKGFRRYPEPRGVRLSNSRIDLTLASFAEAGHGAVYA